MVLTKSFIKYRRNKRYFLENVKDSIFLLSQSELDGLKPKRVSTSSQTFFVSTTKFFFLKTEEYPDNFLVLRKRNLKKPPSFKFSDDNNKVFINEKEYPLIRGLLIKDENDIKDSVVKGLQAILDARREKLEALGNFEELPEYIDMDIPEEKLEEILEKELKKEEIKEDIISEVILDEAKGIIPENQDLSKKVGKKIELEFKQRFLEENLRKSIPKKEGLFDTIHAPKPKSEIIDELSKQFTKKSSIDSTEGLEEALKEQEKKREASQEKKYLVEEIKVLEKEIQDASSIKDISNTENFTFPTDFSRNSNLWFSWNFPFVNTDTFWTNLMIFYDTNPIDLNIKLRDISKNKDHFPVFSSSSSTLAFSSTATDVQNKLVSELDLLNKKNIELQEKLRHIEEEFKKQGISPSHDAEYANLLEEQQELLGSIKRSSLNLEDFKNKIKAFTDAHDNLVPNFYIEIFGKDAILSKYQEIIFDKYIDLNLQINEISTFHKKLEHELIFRLKHLHDARKAQVRIQFLEQQEKFRKNREENVKLFSILQTSANDQEKYKLAEIHEITENIQEKINEEKSKIDYYLNNLKTLNEIENYETKFFNLKKKKEEFTKKKEEFERYIYDLKYTIDKREKQFLSFFNNTKEEVFEFQSEMLSCLFKNNDAYKLSLQILWNAWCKDAIPLIDEILRKKEEVIFQLSDISYSKIKTLYLQGEELLAKANKRQEEWERVFNEIVGEFKNLGYLCIVPKITELQGKYIEKLDTAKLRLSKDTNRILFPNPSLVLNTNKNNLLGLEPRILDDDNFLVIDQVWSTLTDEQEYALQEKLRSEEIENSNVDISEEFKLIKDKYESDLEKEKSTFTSQEIDFASSPPSNSELESRFRELESFQLKDWKEKFFSASSKESTHKQELFGMSKKILSLKTAQIVNSDIVLTDTGFIDNDQTEIYTERDYFTKSPEDIPLDSTESNIDLQIEETDFHSEDNDDIINLINEIENSDVFAEEEKYPSPPPTLEELAQLSTKKYQEKQKTFEVEKLKEKFLYLTDEIDKISHYHKQQSTSLEKIVAERGSLFDEMQIKLNNTQKFLFEQEEELEQILRETERNLDINLMDMAKKEVEDNDNVTKGIKNWFIKLFK